MASTPAMIKPELLTWARKSAGYSLEGAAGKLKITKERLENWESGSERPTIPQLRKIAALYKRPIAVFYLPGPPKEFTALSDFRLVQDKELAKTPELLYAIRQAFSRREIALDLHQELEGEAPAPFEINAKLSDNTEKLAARLKTALDVTTTQQKAWPEAEAFGMWRSKFEQKNVLVFQTSIVPIEIMRGFSISSQPFPVIVLNTKDQQTARIFSMMHEFTHIALRQGGICDFHDSPDVDLEVFCNAVAGAILVPEQELMTEPEVKRNRAISADEVADLARRYRVSRMVVLRRLLIVGRVDQSFYNRLSALYKQEFEQQPKQTGGPRYEVRAFNAAGTLFSRLVLTSYSHDKITASDVSDYLAVKLSSLPQIEKLAWR